MFQVPIVHPNVPSSRCMCLCSSPPSLWAISNPNKWPAPPLDFDFTDEKQISILIWLNWQMRRMQISISYRFGWIAGECASPCVPAQLALNSSVLLRRDPFSFHRNRGKRPPSLPQPPFNVPLTSKIGTFYNLGSRAASFFLPLTMFCRRWLTYSMWLAHNANIRLKISGIFVFPSCLLFIACQVQFEIYHPAMFIIHKHQINTAIHKNYLAFKAQLLIDELVPISVADFKSNFNFILFEKRMEMKSTHMYIFGTHCSSRDFNIKQIPSSLPSENMRFPP